MDYISIVLKMNNGKKFDICLMNPPYGNKKSGSSPFLHFYFVNKCLEIADKNVVIMPSRLLYSTSKEYDNIKNLYNKTLLSAEEIDSSVFQDTGMMPVAIYNFDNKKSKDTILIKRLNDKNEYDINSLNELNTFSQYEKNIFEIVKNNNPNYHPFRPIGKDKKQNLSEFCDKYINTRWKKDNIYLLTSLANGGMNGTFISNTLGQIINNNKDLKNEMIKRKGSCCTIMKFDDVIEAKNCKIALQNSLMRFILYRLQDDQNMTKRTYIGIPDIDWSDNRVRTDEGLLEICGCPKDKCKEYADYCKKIIDEVDKGNRP